jgi:transcriptional regulator
MYLPKSFEMPEWQEIVHFVEQVRAADLVSINEQGEPVSTLMPCIWDYGVGTEGDYGTLYVHMARANKQWRSIQEGANGLAIFHGIQAYISPSNYEAKSSTGKVVPTWNYNAVQLSGKLSVSHDPDYLLKVVSELSRFHESKRATPWEISDAPTEYIADELQGIVAVTMHVTKVQAKAKMSQNRSEFDRSEVIKDLKNSISSEDREVAEYMKLSLKNSD